MCNDWLPKTNKHDAGGADAREHGDANASVGIKVNLDTNAATMLPASLPVKLVWKACGLPVVNTGKFVAGVAPVT